jgi:hypothetical protein
MPINPDANTVLCRIQGLTSAKGQALNGLAASYDGTARPQSDGRLTLAIDGVPSQLSLKTQNLRIVSEQTMRLAVAVGRQDLRSQEFMATTVDEIQGARVSARLIPASPTGADKAQRSNGTLIALKDFFQENPSKKFRGECVIRVTDLNIARVLNKYAYEGRVDMDNNCLEASQQALAKEVGKQLIKRQTQGNATVLVKFRPFRIGREDRPPSGRLQAVLDSKFHIYPCPCDTFLDSLEVRYVLPGASTHEFFLDYGAHETVQYARNVHALNELDKRLSPAVLADVDPQMFWSSVLHSKLLVKELNNLQAPSSLVQEWLNVYSCYLKTIADFRETVSASEAVRLLPNPGTNQWNLINDEIHRMVAGRNAKVAILLNVKWTIMNHESNGAPRATKNTTIQVMDNYIGSELDMEVAKFTQAMRSNDPQDLEIAIAEMVSWGNSRTCDHCGKEHKPKDLKDCSRCKGASYCGPECQRAAWPIHKKVCKELQAAYVPDAETSRIKVQNSAKVSEKRHEKQQEAREQGHCIFAEACGVGYLRILWAPTSPIPNAISYKAYKSDTIFKISLASMGGISGPPSGNVQDILQHMCSEAEEGAFRAFQDDLSDFDPVSQLCLACGPLLNLSLARSVIDEALLQVNGSALELKMKWVGFTPLEWAARKGHQEIVEWLVTDPRTSLLLQVGSPVGWACYTNQVDVARYLVQHGASPEATNEVFWDHRPPLLAAAENGMLEAVKFLVEECNVSISAKWRGNNILDHIEMSPNWKEQKSLKAVRKYAMKKRAKR